MSGWINALLGMRLLKTSLWDLTANSAIERHFDALHELMFAGVPESRWRGAEDIAAAASSIKTRPPECENDLPENYLFAPV